MEGCGGSAQVCVKCKKAIKRTEIVLVCGLWCRKSFHNDCLGLSKSEARAVMCSKVRIKFHCETCDKRLGTELFRGKEANDPKRLENCVNSCVVLELVQNLVKLTNELSNSNLAMNTKLDTVLSSNARLEEYLLQSPKRSEKRSEENPDSVEYVENDSGKRTTEICEQNNDTGSLSENINSNRMECCASEVQQTDGNSSLRIESDFHKKVTGSQQQNVAEECSSNDLQQWEVPHGHNSTQDPRSIDNEEWEEPDGHNTMQDALRTVKEECSPSEDFVVSSTFSIEKAEAEEDEEETVREEAMREYDVEKHSSPEDFLHPSTPSVEMTENEEDKEAENADNFEEVKHEMELTSSGCKPESSIDAGADGDKNTDDRGGLVPSASLAARRSNRIQCPVTEKASCQKKVDTRRLGHNRDISKKTLTQLHQMKKRTHVDRRALLHSCSVCQKTFRSTSSLKLHFRLHTGERPFRCRFCNKSFIQSSDLKRHSRLHTGERPYNCVVCHKRFSCSSNLKHHSRLHTGERPYSCNICQRKFTHSTNFKRHLLLHTKK